MFARKVSIQLLHKQQGFKDEITFAAPGSTEVLAFSLWDTQKNADLYDSTEYKNVLKMLVNVIDGTPKVATTEVLHSTFHEISSAKPIAA
jgi:hypothetical protein